MTDEHEEVAEQQTPADVAASTVVPSSDDADAQALLGVASVEGEYLTRSHDLDDVMFTTKELPPSPEQSPPRESEDPEQ